MGKTTSTPETRALAAAFKGRPRGFVSSVARQIGVEPNNVSHWIHGRRPVPAVYARPLAAILGIDPGAISVAYAQLDLGPHNVSNLPEVTLRPELAESRGANDIDALRHIVNVLVIAMLSHRPAEGAEFARLLRAYVPVKFHSQGFLGEVLALAESRVAPKAKVPDGARPRAKR